MAVAHDHGYGYLQTKGVSGAVFEGASHGAVARSDWCRFECEKQGRNKKTGDFFLTNLHPHFFGKIMFHPGTNIALARTPKGSVRERPSRDPLWLARPEGRCFPLARLGEVPHWPILMPKNPENTGKSRNFLWKSRKSRNKKHIFSGRSTMAPLCPQINASALRLFARGE